MRFNRGTPPKRKSRGGGKITKPFQLGIYCRYVAQGPPPQIWGPSSPVWGRYEFFSFWPIFQRANHDLALADIFYKIKSKIFLVVERSPRGLRVTQKKLGSPIIKLGEMAISIFFRAYLNGLAIEFAGSRFLNFDLKSIVLEWIFHNQEKNFGART